MYGVKQYSTPVVWYVLLLHMVHHVLAQCEELVSGEFFVRLGVGHGLCATVVNARQAVGHEFLLDMAL